MKRLEIVLFMVFCFAAGIAQPQQREFKSNGKVDYPLRAGEA
jgi:hypothetical protein